MKRLFYIFLLILLALMITTSVYAQDGDPEMPTDDEVNAIAREMYCPVCENTPLDVCPTQACAEWRELIRDKLSDGWTEEQIEEYFVLQFGDRVMATPPARGLNWLVYIVPPLAFVAGVYFLYKAFRSMKAAPPKESLQVVEDSQSAESVDDAYYERLEKQLRDL